MSLFPFMKETKQGTSTTPTRHKEYDFDFSTDQLTGKTLEGKEALKVLQKKGLISSPEVWINGEYSKGNVRSLIIKVGQYTK